MKKIRWILQLVLVTDKLWFLIFISSVINPEVHTQGTDETRKKYIASEMTSLVKDWLEAGKKEDNLKAAPSPTNRFMANKLWPKEVEATTPTGIPLASLSQIIKQESATSPDTAQGNFSQTENNHFNIIDLMSEIRCGFFTAFLYKMAEILSEKSNVSIKTFIDVLQKTLDKLMHGNEYDWIHEIFKERSLIVVGKLSSIPTPELKETAKKLITMIKYRYVLMDLDIARVLQKYDQMFLLPVGNDLFMSLLMFTDNFGEIGEVDEANLKLLIEDMIQTILLPAKDNQQDRDFADIIHSLRKIYDKYKID